MVIKTCVIHKTINSLQLSVTVNFMNPAKIKLDFNSSDTEIAMSFPCGFANFNRMASISALQLAVSVMITSKVELVYAAGLFMPL